MSINSRGGLIYFITFISDYLRYGYLYLMRHKFEAIKKFKEFRSEVEKKLGKSIKSLISYRDAEYLNQEFLYYLMDNKILSCRNTMV